MGPEERNDMAKKGKYYTWMRGHFVGLIIDIEHDIDTLIRSSLLSKKSKLNSVFDEKFLHSRQMTLWWKVGLLCHIIESKKYLTGKSLEKFKKQLEDLIIERNKWAHSPIFFEQKKIGGKLDMIAYLSYINSKGKFADQQLKEKYFKDLQEKLTDIIKQLRKIMKKRKLIQGPFS
jgi:hypothetical protein